MLNYIIDYDDMSRAGLVKTAENIDTGEQKYAIIIKFPKSKVGKFNIATKEATENSIYALEHNAIPAEIEKIARYFVKQAAIHFDIPANWDATETKREIKFEDINFPKSVKTVYTVKIANEQFPLTTVTQIKLAEEYFLARMHRMSIPDRVKIATAIIKEGTLKDFKPNDIIRIYAHPHLSNRIDEEINIRRHTCEKNARYIEVLNQVVKIKDKLDPITFVEQIRQLDKVAEFIPEKIGHSYSNFFKSDTKINPIDIKNIIKVAEILDKPNPKDAEKLSKLL